MAKYRVLKPVAFVVGKAVVHKRRSGEVVEIADDQAASLTAAGRVEPVVPPAECGEVKSRPPRARD